MGASEALLCAGAGCGEWCRGCGASALGSACALRQAAAELGAAPAPSGPGARLCDAWEALEGRQAARAGAAARTTTRGTAPACAAEAAVERAGADGWAAALRALHKAQDGDQREVRGGQQGW